MSNSQTYFCPRCFADSDGGSWGHAVIDSYCTNCGSHGAIEMDKDVVELIRHNASWVGKRFYPHKEDEEMFEERNDLLQFVKEFPGRQAIKKVSESGEIRFNVSQQLPNGRKIETLVNATDEADAMRKCGLRYVPYDRLIQNGN